jgi:hypothetical protein
MNEERHALGNSSDEQEYRDLLDKLSKETLIDMIVDITDSIRNKFKEPNEKEKP